MSSSVDDTGLQFIRGRRRRGGSSDPLTVTNAASGEVVATDTLASVDDAHEAVGAAKAALPGWAGATPAERSTAMHRLAAELEAVAGELATAESRQAGKPIRLTTGFDVPGTIDNVAFFAGAARNLDGKASAEYSGEHTSGSRREPIGVIASIAPWNYPLQMAAWKILPAIAAGNSIVLKPAELTPTTSVAFAATRAYIQHPLYDAFVDRVAELMSQVVLGPVDDPATDLGSLISTTHRDNVAGMPRAASPLR